MDWVKKLEPGHKVIVETDKRSIIKTVKRIYESKGRHPELLIELENCAVRFNMRGRSVSPYFHKWLVEATHKEIQARQANPKKDLFVN